MAEIFKAQEASGQPKELRISRFDTAPNEYPRFSIALFSSGRAISDPISCSQSSTTSIEVYDFSAFLFPGTAPREFEVDPTGQIRDKRTRSFLTARDVAEYIKERVLEPTNAIAVDRIHASNVLSQVMTECKERIRALNLLISSPELKLVVRNPLESHGGLGAFWIMTEAGARPTIVEIRNGSSICVSRPREVAPLPNGTSPQFRVDDQGRISRHASLESFTGDLPMFRPDHEVTPEDIADLAMETVLWQSMTRGSRL